MKHVSANILASIAALALSTAASPVAATSGGLNAEGCHNDRKGGTGYHCHRAPSRALPMSSVSRARPLGLVVSSGGAFRNCTAARAAGAAPIRRGDSGYGSHLDRDGDGIACE